MAIYASATPTGFDYIVGATGQKIAFSCGLSDGQGSGCWGPGFELVIVLDWAVMSAQAVVVYFFLGRAEGSAGAQAVAWRPISKSGRGKSNPSR
jgi:hypothetical protein